ncbi:RNA ligase family protein [Ramlibacter sp. AN1133]|uniref:RNA ligase family protein n=1 Tax=Ramlibacter sp. AN1133 TaxID=3133429 RepID=UPI0030C11289
MATNPTTDTGLPFVTLYKREGSADKVYQLSIGAGKDAGTYDALFKNARRGQPLKTTSKSLLGVSLGEARAAFDSVLKAKTEDGYTEDEGGQAYTNSEFTGRVSGLRPQLPKVATEELLPQLLADPRWGLAEKANGENRMLQRNEQGEIRGANKKGLWVDIPQEWVQRLHAAATDPFILCGEHVGEKLYVFDALQLAGRDIRHLPFRERYHLMVQVLATWNVPHLVLLQTDFDPAAKARRFEELRAGNREGVVFKLADQPHCDGYSDASLKFKFCESSACQVLTVNQKRSVAIGLVDSAGTTVPVGNVTVPPNVPVPQAGDVVEVAYLYYNPGGAFEQPVWCFKRGDMDPSECLLSQVTRFKPEAEEETQERPRMRA